MERISTEKQRLHTECEERRRQEKKDLLTRDASGKVFAHADLWSNVPGQVRENSITPFRWNACFFFYVFLFTR